MEELSDEILVHILLFLPIGDLFRVAAVNTHWKAVVYDPLVWKSVIMRNFPGADIKRIAPESRRLVVTKFAVGTENLLAGRVCRRLIIHNARRWITTAVQYSTELRLVLSSGWDGTLELFDISQFDNEHDSTVPLHCDGLAQAHNEWRADSFRSAITKRGAQRAAKVQIVNKDNLQLCWAANGLIMSCYSNTMCFLTVDTDSHDLSVRKQQHGAYKAAWFDGSRAISVNTSDSHSTTVQLTTPEGETTPLFTFASPQPDWRDLKFANNTVLVGGATVHLFDIASGKEIWKFTNQSICFCVDYDDNHRTLLLGSRMDASTQNVVFVDLRYPDPMPITSAHSPKTKICRVQLIGRNAGISTGDDNRVSVWRGLGSSEPKAVDIDTLVPGWVKGLYFTGERMILGHGGPAPQYMVSVLDFVPRSLLLA